MSELERVVETSIRYNGRKYSKKPNGYYYNCSTRKHLHQAIWIDNNGPIPKGYEIHHIDFDKENNDISNLACITIAEHHKIHKDAMTDEQKQRMRDNLAENARPKASEWHKSDEGREWHKEHAKQMAKNGTLAFVKQEELICSCCGKKYIGIRNKTKRNISGNTFCSGKCKARYLRYKRSIDKSDVRICAVCGKEFRCSKWSSSKTCSSECASILAYSRRGN